MDASVSHSRSFSFKFWSYIIIYNYNDWKTKQEFVWQGTLCKIMIIMKAGTESAEPHIHRSVIVLPHAGTYNPRLHNRIITTKPCQQHY